FWSIGCDSLRGSSSVAYFWAPRLPGDRVLSGCASLRFSIEGRLSPHFRPLVLRPSGLMRPPAVLTLSDDRGGASTVRQGSGHATNAAPSPIFRAPKASLVQTGCPSAPVVLD